jgi:hypothetical protein
MRAIWVVLLLASDGAMARDIPEVSRGTHYDTLGERLRSYGFRPVNQHGHNLRRPELRRCSGSQCSFIWRSERGKTIEVVTTNTDSPRVEAIRPISDR